MAIIITLVTVSALVGLDQFIKYLVITDLKPIGSVEIIKGIISFTYVENTGAVFGSFSASTALLTVVSVVLLIFTVVFMIKNKNLSKYVNACLVLMVSGGIGNVIDRIRLHHVVDFIEPTFVNFAVFNFADCLITVGAFALIIYLFVDMFRDSKKMKDKIKQAESENKYENG